MQNYALTTANNKTVSSAFYSSGNKVLTK